MQGLCFANVPGAPPQPWVEVHGLIQEGLRAHCDSLPPGSRQRSTAEARSGAIDLDWLMSVMARLHVNAFRCEQACNQSIIRHESERTCSALNLRPAHGTDQHRTHTR